MKWKYYPFNTHKYNKPIPFSIPFIVIKEIYDDTLVAPKIGMSSVIIGTSKVSIPSLPVTKNPNINYSTFFNPFYNRISIYNTCFLSHIKLPFSSISKYKPLLILSPIHPKNFLSKVTSFNIINKITLSLFYNSSKQIFPTNNFQKYNVTVIPSPLDLMELLNTYNEKDPYFFDKSINHLKDLYEL